MGRTVNIEDTSRMVMTYTLEEVEEMYNDFFEGLGCMELIPIKNKETVLKSLDLKKAGKGYKQEEITTSISYVNDMGMKLEVDFITFFKPKTLEEYGIFVPELELVDDMLLPSPYLDSNIVIDNILNSLSRELGRSEYERDSIYSGIEKFFQFIHDSNDIEIRNIEEVDGEINIFFSFPIEEVG